MSLSKMNKEDLELLSNKDITNLILEESKTSMNTAELFKEIIRLLELPDSVFETKIGDYYTALSTDKRFILLDDGKWDLRSRHTSDKVAKIIEEDEEEESENEPEKEEIEEIDEDNYDDTEEEYDEDANEELKDLVVIDEDEIELEQ